MIPAISLDEEWRGYAPIDGNTPIHFLVGMVAGLSNLNASWATVVVIGFEAMLITLEKGSIAAPFEQRAGQSYGNQAVDTMVGIMGVAVGESVKRKRDLYYAQQAELQLQNAAAAATPAPAQQEAPVAGVEFINTEFPLVRVKGVRSVR
jgi:hypothetical protein